MEEIRNNKSTKYISDKHMNSVRINKCVRNGTYLIQVVDAAFAAVVVLDDRRFLVLRFTYPWLSVFSAEEQHVLVPFGGV